MSNFSIGLETGVGISNVSDGKVSDVHTHPSNSGEGFSGGYYVVNGKHTGYDGDIALASEYRTNSYVFRVRPNSGGWYFSTTDFHAALSRPGGSNYQIHQTFVRKIR